MKHKFQFDNLYIHFVGDIDDCYVKKIRGDIDNLISRQGLRAVIFDFKDVSFIDSTGLGLIFGRYKRLKDNNVELLLQNVPAHVDKVFRARGVYSLCPKI